MICTVVLQTKFTVDSASKTQSQDDDNREIRIIKRSHFPHLIL